VLVDRLLHGSQDTRSPRDRFNACTSGPYCNEAANRCPLPFQRHRKNSPELLANLTIGLWQNIDGRCHRQLDKLARHTRFSQLLLVNYNVALFADSLAIQLQQGGSHAGKYVVTIQEIGGGRQFFCQGTAYASHRGNRAGANQSQKKSQLSSVTVLDTCGRWRCRVAQFGLGARHVRGGRLVSCQCDQPLHRWKGECGPQRKPHLNPLHKRPLRLDSWKEA
jgi:hypothetical protein